ncbi:MAG: DUF192 domain-containing protein [Deltaproteobacteria bacterium]|nr:DUF192 domain-containing protein [Deltaproteobacteria bacterium]
MIRRSIFLVPLLLATLAACPGARRADAGPPDAGPRALPPGVITVTPVGREPIPVKVELCLNDADRARGMMFRESLEGGHGMLFIFEQPKIQRFWMKNTLIPLDMIFIDSEGKVVGVVHEAEPLTTTSRYVDRPSRWVLEVPGGWARANGIDAGATVRTRTLPEGVSVTD